MTDNDKNAVITIDEIARYLRLVRECCGTGPIVDIHVHATEVIRDSIHYKKVVDGVYSALDECNYRNPHLNSIRLTPSVPVKSSPLQNKMSELTFTKAYQYSGPKVLADQMDLAGVDMAVLLPVAGGDRDITKQMSIIDDCCRSSNRFVAGYSLSDASRAEYIGDELERAVSKFGIKIIKIHPNLSGIDLNSNAGRSKVEAVLTAANQFKIPVLIHGGCSPILGNSPARRYGAIANLRRIDWSKTDFPVVIAHFGVYGCEIHAHEPLSEEKKEFAKMLNDNPNLYTDTSGVTYHAIENMLSLVNYSKIVFGSDALYVPIYRQMVYFLHALESAGASSEVIKKTMSENAKNILQII